MEQKELMERAITLLKALIETPSFSGEESETAQLIENWLQGLAIPVKRRKNNIWATNKYFDHSKPNILLNSHHDTVKPNKGYKRDPFQTAIENGKLYGLGSNDAGGSLVSLMALFAHFYDKADLAYNIIFAATAEEEISGHNGISLLIPELPSLDFALVGEPTGMQMSIAGKGLLVIDGYSSGTSGHAAHDNTDNAIYSAVEDILWIKDYEFPKVSDVLGKVKMTVTQIEAGSQHNVVPDNTHFVIDVRVNEHYTNRDVFEIIDEHTKSKLEARSFRLNSSSIAIDHPIVQAGIKLGCKTYGSPTLSDQALLNCPSLKMGPGDSARSHTADEFIYLHEIKEGIDLYIKLFEELVFRGEAFG